MTIYDLYLQEAFKKKMGYPNLVSRRSGTKKKQHDNYVTPSAPTSLHVMPIADDVFQFLVMNKRQYILYI